MSRTARRWIWMGGALCVLGVVVIVWQSDGGLSRLIALPFRLVRLASERLSAGAGRNPDGLYQQGQFAALGEGAVPDVAAGRVTFKALSHAKQLDFNREVDYRLWRLKCPTVGGAKDVDMAGTIMRVYTDVQCEIVGERPKS